jgi:hypothetical protein
MHNGKGDFEYFVTYFGKSYSAIHGSTSLLQAVFVNEAISTIKELYKTNNNATAGYEFPGIMLVAHSAGGMVARTSLVLDTHPSDCPVNSIIMLGSPNQRPAYSP